MTTTAEILGNRFHERHVAFKTVLERVVDDIIVHDWTVRVCEYITKADGVTQFLSERSVDDTQRFEFIDCRFPVVWNNIVLCG